MEQKIISFDKAKSQILDNKLKKNMKKNWLKLLLHQIIYQNMLLWAHCTKWLKLVIELLMILKKEQELKKYIDDKL